MLQVLGNAMLNGFCVTSIKRKLKCQTKTVMSIAPIAPVVTIASIVSIAPAVPIVSIVIIAPTVSFVRTV